MLKLQGADHVLSLPSSAQVDKEFDAFPLECKSVVMNIPETWEEVLPITPPLCIFFLYFFSLFTFTWGGGARVCLHAHRPMWHEAEVWRSGTAARGHFVSSTLWALVIGLRLSGAAASTFAC